MNVSTRCLSTIHVWSLSSVRVRAWGKDVGSSRNDLFLVYSRFCSGRLLGLLQFDVRDLLLYERYSVCVGCKLTWTMRHMSRICKAFSLSVYSRYDVELMNAWMLRDKPCTWMVSLPYGYVGALVNVLTERIICCIHYTWMVVLRNEPVHSHEV